MFNRDIETWTKLGANYTATEISQQPATWLKTFDIIKDVKDDLKAFVDSVVSNSDHDIIITGAGTSEFVGNTIAPVLQRGHILNVRSIPTTDLVIDPKLYFNPNKPTLLISLGRSGNSPESVASVDVANQVHPNVKHLVITCNHEGSLAMREDDNIFAIKLPKETNDKSFAMTSSYSNMYLAIYLTFNIDRLTEVKPHLDEVAHVAENFNTDGYKVIEDLVNDFDFERIVYLGDTQHEAVAQESALKILELTAGITVPLYNTPLGFRHGPKSIINSKTLVVVYMQNDGYVRKYQKDFIKEISVQRDGTQLMVIDTQNDADIQAMVDKYVSIKYNNTVDFGLEVLNLVMYGQTMSLYKSIAVGKNPDNPWPSGQVNRVVQGVIIYPFEEE